MRMDCEMLGALLSERRRGELSPEETRALDAHLSGCARCREETAGLDAVLAAVELPPLSIAELDALRSRQIGEAPPRMSRSSAWRFPAVLVAAAAAAVLTVSIRPLTTRHRPVGPTPSVGQAVPAVEALPDDMSQELFPQMSSDTNDDGQATLEDDVLSLEGAGLFGNLDG
ncbi:MAG TPA: zf-HC2 domain-containing protein [Myxococcaceae bacterium]